MRIVKAKPRQVALLGLSFKKGTDDLRESPYLLLAERLLAEGLTLKIFDPDVLPDRLVGKNREYVEQHLPNVDDILMGSLDAALLGSDVVVVCKAVQPAEQLLQTIGKLSVFDLEYLLVGHTARHCRLPETVLHDNSRHPDSHAVLSTRIGCAQRPAHGDGARTPKAGYSRAGYHGHAELPAGHHLSEYKGGLTMREEVDGIPVRRVWLYPASGRGAIKRLLNYLSFTLTGAIALAKSAGPTWCSSRHNRSRWPFRRGS